MPFTQFRGGKLPPRRSLKVPALGDFLDKATAWPPVPAAGWEFAVPPGDWGMLGNDTVGDCAIAGIYHLLQGQSYNTDNPLHGTTDQALALYSAVTGYNPSDPSSDQGTVLVSLLDYVVKNGVEMLDVTGKTVTVEIVGYASLDISSVAQRRYGAFTFGGAFLGINCPEKCESDTDNWNFGPGLPLAGGHCITQEGEGAAGGQTCSWGMIIPTSNSFYAAYLDEGYIVVAKSWLDAQGQSPTGLDLDGLVTAMKAVQAG